MREKVYEEELVRREHCRGGIRESVDKGKKENVNKEEGGEKTKEFKRMKKKKKRMSCNRRTSKENVRMIMKDEENYGNEKILEER